MSHYFPLFEQAGINLDGYSLMKDPTDFIKLGIQDPGDLDLLTTCAKTLRAHMNIYKPNTIYEEPIPFKQNNSESSLHSSIVERAIHVHQATTSSLPSSPSASVRYRPKQINPTSTRPLSMPVFLPSQTPPPDYHHDVVLSRKDRCKSMIIPREEEGREELPPYSCTVFKMGYVNIKKEYDAPNVRTRWRNWRKLYFELWGTMLRIYRTVPPKNDRPADYNSTWPLGVPYYYYHRYYYTPILTLSLAGAEASRALDYFKRPNVLRLTTHEGPQLLLRLSSHVEMISWVEHLQAGK
ncbi:hypothetical protein G6F56_011980 [Rhizopus delemar]|nr:hypothetical protein G6F56_011980 [Rhizopus delemar]